ncbi:MAG: hypothetical protein ACOX6X_07870 [Dethiobacteria bacterium]|jgi:hypothetical protein
MAITLDQVETLREKTGLTYTEAVEVLEKTGKDLIKALIFLEKEDKMPRFRKKNGVFWRKLFLEAINAKIRVNSRRGTIFRIPLPLGLTGAALFPRVAAWGTIALLLARCSMQLER